MAYKFKVLSIDGGGIRGIIPATILAEIEKETGKRIFEMFDLIAGTSTGGILAVALTKPDPNQPDRAQFKAEELVSLYEGEAGRLIFQHQPKFALEPIIDQALKTIKNLFHLPQNNIEDLIRPRFSSNGRQRVLEDRLGSTLIEKAVKEVFITSYDTQLRRPVFFTSNLEREKKTGSFHNVCKGITMKDAAMATSAAPTYFPACRIDNQDTTYVPTGYYSLVDGGVFANNPTALAIMEAIISYNNNNKENGSKLSLDDILVVSLGTGSLTRSYNYDQVKNWGQLQWALPMLDVVFDGQIRLVRNINLGKEKW